MGIIKLIKGVRHKYSIKDIEVNLERHDLIRRSKILFIDDEIPELIDDLKKSNFSVDHIEDLTPDNVHLLDPRKYDMILLDFGNVGKKWGDEEGLSLLKHIKRVNPLVVVISYTSKALPPKQASDFFRLADQTLEKDAGIADSMARIEEGLRKAYSIERTWDAFLKIIRIEKNSPKDLELQNDYVHSIKSDKKRTLLKKKITELTNSDTTDEIAQSILGILIELGIKGIIAVI